MNFLFQLRLSSCPPSGLRPWFGAMRIVVVPNEVTQPANHTANNQSQRPTALLTSFFSSSCRPFPIHEMRLRHHTFQKMHLQISKDTNVNAHLERRYDSLTDIMMQIHLPCPNCKSSGTISSWFRLLTSLHHF